MSHTHTHARVCRKVSLEVNIVLADRKYSFILNSKEKKSQFKAETAALDKPITVSVCVCVCVCVCLGGFLDSLITHHQAKTHTHTHTHTHRK